MSSAPESAHIAPYLTLDPETGAIRLTWIPDIHYHSLEHELHQTRVMRWGAAGTQFTPSNHLVENERLPTTSKGTSAPTAPSVTHSVTSRKETTPNIHNASTLVTWSEGFSPTTSGPTSMYPGSFPVSNEVSPIFRGRDLPHQSQCTPAVRSPSTERSVSLSPTASISPLASPCPGSSCRHPVQVEPKVILSNPRLHALVHQIFKEPWFINGQPERNSTDREASIGLGSIGKSVFLAFATRLRDGSARVGKWRCLICDTLPVKLSNGKEYTSAREDRILKHIRHHFGHRPWVCGGQCGMGECSMKFLSKEALDSHQRLDETARCDLCGIIILRRNLSRHRGTWCKQKDTHQPLMED